MGKIFERLELPQYQFDKCGMWSINMIPNYTILL